MQAQILTKRITNFLFSNKGFILACTLMVFILAIFSAQTFGKAFRAGGYDFTSYLLSSTALFNGSSPYATGSPFPFIYPLFLCIVLFPLTLVPYWFATGLWFIVNAAALYLTALILLRLFPNSLSSKEIVALCLVPFLILVNVIQNNLLNGQINFIVLLLSAVFLKYYLEPRKLLAIVFLSLAISIKLTPIIFVVYLLVRRDFFYAGVTLVFSMFLTLGLPYAIVGHKTMEWYTEYVQSVFTHKFLFQDHAFEGPTYSITSVVVSLFPSFKKFLSVSIAAIASLLPIVWAQISSRKGSANTELNIFCLYLLAILFISPVSETHHLINLFPAILFITVTMLLHSGRHFQFGILTLSIVLISLVAGRYLDVANIVAIGALYGSMLWILFQENEPIAGYGTNEHKPRTI